MILAVIRFTEKPRLVTSRFYFAVKVSQDSFSRVVECLKIGNEFAVDGPDHTSRRLRVAGVYSPPVKDSQDIMFSLGGQLLYLCKCVGVIMYSSRTQLSLMSVVGLATLGPTRTFCVMYEISRQSALVVNHQMRHKVHTYVERSKK